MSAESIYETWAPPEAVWSPWAKPVLFSHLPRRPGDISLPPPQMQLPWLRGLGRVALVVDLPGGESIAAGLAAARAGWRPVPLYNCGTGPSAVVSTEDLLTGLISGAQVLSELSLPDDAPPAFLLDSRRRGEPNISPAPGRYDNRWVTLPQDFPSANFLHHQGITGACVIQPVAQDPAEDLSHALCRWQQGEIPISVASTAPGARPEQIRVSEPSFFRAFFARMMVAAGLRRSAAGGFGGLVPQASSSSGSYG